MKITTYSFPRSSFLAVDKDLDILINLFSKNERFKKLMYYDINDPLSQPNVPQDKFLEMFSKQIKTVPKLTVDDKEFCYLFILFDDFYENDINPQFRQNTLTFVILCHFNQWKLKDLKQRPYLIAAEIDSMLNKRKLTGIGLTKFIGMRQQVSSDEFGGLILVYETMHRYDGEDSKYPLNPAEQQDIINNFNDIFNDKDHEL